MIIEKKEIKTILKRLKKTTSSCVVGEIFWGTPKRGSIEYIKRKGFAVKKIGMMNIITKSENDMLSDDVCLKIAKTCRAL